MVFDVIKKPYCSTLDLFWESDDIDKQEKVELGLYLAGGGGL